MNRGLKLLPFTCTMVSFTIQFQEVSLGSFSGDSCFLFSGRLELDLGLWDELILSSGYL